MSNKRQLINGKAAQGHCKVFKERLPGVNVILTDFVFEPGGNVYVFSYEKNGVKKHIFIDAGDTRYGNQYLDLLTENAINPAHIERILITHRHRDHCGLAGPLARESGATILVHPGFRDFVEGRFQEEERWWLRGFDPTALKAYDIQYLALHNGDKSINIGGIDFPRLGNPIEIDKGSRLDILACPESSVKHSPDQLVVLYSPSGQSGSYEQGKRHFRPTDDIIFSGDIWLMQGPLYHTRSIQQTLRMMRVRYFQIRNWISNRHLPRINIREQDEEAKEALKQGFHLIRVKPGHGDEFIGSKLIPRSVLADRDLLVNLGFPINANKSVLKEKAIAPKVAALKNQAFTRFVEELREWREWGFTVTEIAELITRLYKEQSGGRGSIRRDRKERRRIFHTSLMRLAGDDAASKELRQLAEAALLSIQNIK